MGRADVYTIYKCIILYGCETWVLKEREKSSLQATEMRVLRKITGVSRLDHVRNETVRERLGLEPVLKKVERIKERMLEGEGREQERKCGGESADGGRSREETERTVQKAVERSLLRERNYRCI